MGIFSFFKKSPQIAKTGGRSLLNQLVPLYGLGERKPYEPSLEGTWWEGSVNNMPVAFQAGGDGLVVFVGKIAEITDIYLIRTAADTSADADLERILGPGHDMAVQFHFGATPRGAFDMPQLRLPALMDGLPKLSPSVREVAIYEGRHGLSLRVNAPDATPETIEADLKLAQAVVKALEGAA